MNSYSFKIQNIKQECPSELFLGDKVVFQGEAYVTGQVKKDLHQNEDVQTTSIIEPVLVEVKTVHYDLEPFPVFKGELKKSSQSKKIRDRLYILWTERGSKGSFEDYYQEWTDDRLEDIDELIEEEKMEGLV